MRVVTGAGFDGVAVEARDATLDAPDTQDDVAEWLIEIGPAGAAYRDAAAEAKGLARGGAVRLLERFRTPGVGYRLPTGVWVLTAVAPEPAG